MENKNNVLKKIKIYSTGAVLIASTAIGIKEYSKRHRATAKPETPTTTIELTNEVTPTMEPTYTPTATPTITPTSTPTPTATPVPTPMPSERSISSADLRDMSFINNDYFGEKEDLDTEISKRKEFLESFEVLDNNETDILLKCINKDSLGTGLSESEINALGGIVRKIFNYNINNQDNVIPLNMLGVDLNDEEKITYACFEELCMRTYSQNPKNATTDSIWATTKDSTEMFSFPLTGVRVLKPVTTNGGTDQTQYIDKYKLGTSCQAIMCYYIICTAEPYTVSGSMDNAIYTAKQLLNSTLIPGLRVAESKGYSLQK